MARSDDRAHRQINNDNDDDEGPPRRDRSRKSGSSHHSSSSPNRKKKRKFAKSHHRRHHRSHHQHHHAAAAADEEPPPAELAAATLLEHFRQILQGEGQGQSERDVQKARNALEATAGNMQMAAQLYWDDYFASHAAAAANQDVDQKPAARKRGDTDSGGSDGSDDEDGDEYLKPHRKLRRSLDRDFQAADDTKRKAHEDDDDNEDEDGDDEDNNDILDNDRDNQRQMLMDAIAGQQDRILAELAGESASVSDDEAVAGGVWRIVDDAVGNVGGGIEKKETKAKKHRNQSRPPNDFGRRIREAAAAVANEVLPQFKESPQGGKRRNKVEKEDDGEEEDYISDSDWLEEEAAVVGSPFEPLWGEGDREATSTSAVNEGNVVANDENDEFLVDSGVPDTWLNASFSLASCGGGLGIKPPKVEDVELFCEWGQQQNSRSGVPPPHHCRAITAILSMVTAIIYTGASIQGNEVNCTSGRKPFMELTEQERKREFESRLADALSSLIFIAAKASSARKRRAFNKARKEIGTTEVRIKKMQRRLRLIPTCSWEEQPINIAPRAPGTCSYRRIDVATSLTNVKDIRTYVLSNMRAFTARGGVALLLETISRIHGKGVISRMMERARKGANNACTTQKHLLCCSCEDRQTKMYEDNPLPRSVRNDPSKLLDTSPPGHECVTVELLSLLLTGHVHSSWKGWSTEDFGFGVLIGNAEVDWRFSRPEKPVWVLQGETCYSVLWIEEDKENVSKTISKLDKPGTSLTLGHWNCWYGERNKSEMRLITSSGEWKRPKVAGKFDGSAWQERCDLKPPKGTVDLLIDRRCEKKLNLQSVYEHEANKTKEQECRITREELELTKAHPEDQRFYPGKHRMWRFDMGEGDKADGDCQTAGDVKMRGEQWVPYHRLTARQKLLVETKLGPKIKSILWSRWPGARIDNFVPAGEPYPIV